MDLQHRLMRQTINIAVSKAMEDMKSNTRRSIRNLIDLGLLFSHSENQKWFFSTAHKVVSNPRNPYNLLSSRMISDIDKDTIKTVGLNLGYSSLVYGANKLKKRHEETGCSFPWLIMINDLEPCPVFFSRMEKLLDEGRDLGVYSYIFCPRKAGEIIALCTIAQRFEECLFVFKTPPSLITDETAEALRKAHNAVVSVQAADADLSRESCIKAFRLLKQNRCFYGFHLHYNENNMKEITATEYVRSAVRLGNVFAVYVADNDASKLCRESVYSFVCNARGENGQPLIALEWFRDIHSISDKILSGGGCMAVNLARTAFNGCKKTKNILENTLFELIQNSVPCFEV